MTRPDLFAVSVFSGISMNSSGSESHILYIVFLRLDFNCFYKVFNNFSGIPVFREFNPRNWAEIPSFTQALFLLLDFGDFPDHRIYCKFVIVFD